ncbi:hypothetical protein WJ63_15800 [Burkholderia pyrrocinia]|nr:hypothetical protein WJ63_15800 [Burkholderia pyrrocinia]
MTSKLTACPFCGFTDCTVSLRSINSWKFVYCPDCLAEGPACETEDEAVAAWTRRAPTQQPSGEVTSADLSALLPGTYYMDPPDGGDVSLLEQLRRMAADAARYRSAAAFNDEAREFLYGNLDTIQSAIELADAAGNSRQARGLEAVEYQIRRLFAGRAQGGGQE